jgi:ABC-type branched-subunit amino acid transport system substrate-binding protein
LTCTIACNNLASELRGTAVHINTRPVTRIAGIIAVTGLALTACSSSGKSSTATTIGAASTGATTPTTAAALSGTGGGPATGTPIKIGLVTSLTGIASSGYLTAADGAKAYFTAINQQGGFDGHPLELVVKDDQSSTTGAATATEELISSGVHAIIPDSGFFYGGYKAAQQAGIPVVGPNIDGPEWGLQPNTNMFPAFLGGADAKHPVVQSSLGAAAVLQFLGAKNVGALTYGISPTSVSVINDLKTALGDVGIKMGYENTSLNIGTTDVTSPALAIKSQGVDAVVCACLENTELALNTTLQQEGVKAYSISLDTPDSVAFDTPAAKLASQNVYFFSLIAPLTTPASMVFENRLHAVYPGYTVGTYMT